MLKIQIFKWLKLKLLIMQRREPHFRQSPLSRSNAEMEPRLNIRSTFHTFSHFLRKKYSFKFLRLLKKTFEKFFLCLGFKMKLASSGYNCVCQFGKIGDLEKWGGHSPGEI